jgi:hypothetical protein
VPPGEEEEVVVVEEVVEKNDDVHGGCGDELNRSTKSYT